MRIGFIIGNQRGRTEPGSDQRRTLQPREQKRKTSRRLRPHISQVFVTPLPCLGCGLPFRKTIFALFIMYVCTQEISMNLETSDTLTTLWYDDLRIWRERGERVMIESDERE